MRSAPHDLGKTRKKKSHCDEFTSAAKTRHRGGWITEEDPGDYYSSKFKPNNNWRSPSNSFDRRVKIPRSYGDYASSSHSSEKPRKLNFNSSPSNGSSRYHQHRYSASRFGNNDDGMGRNNNWW